MKKLLNVYKELLGKSKKIILVFIFVIALQSVFVIGEKFFSAYYGIDVALVSKDVSKLVFCGLIILVLSLIDTALFHYVYRRGNKEYKSICLSLKKQVFDKSINLDMEYHNHHPSGAVINTIDSDVELFASSVTWTIPMLMRFLTRIILCLLILTIINPLLSLILWIIAPLFFVVNFFILRKLEKLHEQRRKIARSRIAHINEGIMGVNTIKSLNLEDKEDAEFIKLSNKYYKVRLKSIGFSQLFWRIFDVAFYTSLIALFLSSYKLGISYGELFLYYNLFETCLNSITSLNDTLDVYFEELVSTNKIYDLMHKDSFVKDKEKTIDKKDDLGADIKFENVTFTYDKGETVLENLNLEIKKHTRVAIVGKTGSGKSTIASLLFRFYEPNKGRITFDGIDYRDLKLAYLHKQIGFILQEPLLFDDTIANNIRYGKIDASDKEIEDVCKLVGADEFIQRLKNKYDTHIGEGGIILSVGQKQLIAFARMLISDPSVIILDEATSNIDSQSEALIQKNINEAFKGKTCLIIAHRLSTIRDCDKIIYLEKGKIIEEGSHEELMALNEKYATLYNNQFIKEKLEKLT